MRVRKSRMDEAKSGCCRIRPSHSPFIDIFPHATGTCRKRTRSIVNFRLYCTLTTHSLPDNQRLLIQFPLCKVSPRCPHFRFTTFAFSTELSTLSTNSCAQAKHPSFGQLTFSIIILLENSEYFTLLFEGGSQFLRACFLHAVQAWNWSSTGAARPILQ